jgi:hypothetical protein
MRLFVDFTFTTISKVTITSFAFDWLICLIDSEMVTHREQPFVLSFFLICESGFRARCSQHICILQAICVEILAKH